MTFSAVLSIQGLLLIFEGFFMLWPAGFSIYYGDDDLVSILIAAGITLGLGLLLRLGFRFKGELRLKDSYAIVSFGWILAALFGAIPFYLSGYVPSFTNAFFESMSGFTTTGASILTDVEALPHGLLLWRSLTQWLGGMGIIMLSLAILPLLGVGGMQLYKAEIPSPLPDKLTPRLQETAKILWGVYALLSLIEALLLMAGGMNLFDSLCHTFTTMATGGFSTKNASIGHFNNLYIEVVVIIFMILAGTNFSLHFHGVRGRISAYWKSEEFRFYLGFILIGIVTVSIINTFTHSSDLFSSGRHSSFQVVSIMTTTGFTTVDFSQWPPAGQMVLLLLMFLGGCAGSTGGSLKILRVMILLKQARSELKRLLHPHAVIPVRMDERVVSSAIVSNILSFILLYIFIFISSSLVMSFLGLDIVSALSSVAATLGNVGPGLGIVSPASNYSSIPDAGKWLLSFCMLAGRLEVYTLLVLLTKDFWK